MSQRSNQSLSMTHHGREWQTAPVFLLRTPWTVWKGKKIWCQKMSPHRSEGIQHAPGEKQRAITNSSRKNEEAGSKRKWRWVADVSGGESQVGGCKEQYCTGTWNVRSMNQGKLEVVQQELARVNIATLGISELKWTGMGEFNPGGYYICHYGQEYLRRNGVALKVKRVRNAVLGCNLKNDRMILVHFQSKVFNITGQRLPQPLMLKKLKLNGFTKTYKTF